jgi:hypothetical protein
VQIRKTLCKSTFKISIAGPYSSKAIPFEGMEDEVLQKLILLDKP